MNNKIYCGSGKELFNGDMVSISLSVDDIPQEWIKQSKNGKRYLNLKVCRKKQVDQYGKTHYVEVDTWTPNQQNQQQQNNFNNNPQNFGQNQAPPPQNGFNAQYQPEQDTSGFPIGDDNCPF